MNKKQFLIKIVSIFTLCMFYVLVFNKIMDYHVRLFPFLLILIVSVLPSLYVLIYSKKISLYQEKIIYSINGLSVSSAILLFVFSILFILTFFEKQIGFEALLTLHVKTILITYAVCFFVTGFIDSYQLKKLNEKESGDPWIYSLFLYLIQVGYAYLAFIFIYVNFF
ncbi:MAG: hypothetical protein KAU20_03985 [Nanoarchaeota archaeon]|nr:hypothetical protein [Nanoarchaeota archaeon]